MVLNTLAVHESELARFTIPTLKYAAILLVTMSYNTASDMYHLSSAPL